MQLRKIESDKGHFSKLHNTEQKRQKGKPSMSCHRCLIYEIPENSVVSLSYLLIATPASLQVTTFPSHTVLEEVGNWRERHFPYQSTGLLIPAVKLEYLVHTHLLTRGHVAQVRTISDLENSDMDARRWLQLLLGL